MNHRRIAEAYFNKWWLPSAVAYCINIIFIWMQSFILHGVLEAVANVLAILSFASQLGIMAASVNYFRRKRWRDGLLNLLMFPVLFAITFYITVFYQISTASRG